MTSPGLLDYRPGGVTVGHSLNCPLTGLPVLDNLCTGLVSSVHAGRCDQSLVVTDLSPPPVPTLAYAPAPAPALASAPAPAPVETLGVSPGKGELPSLSLSLSLLGRG